MFTSDLQHNGTWAPVDFSNCTALNDAIPTLTVSFIVNVPQADVKAIVDNVYLYVIKSNQIFCNHLCCFTLCYCLSENWPSLHLPVFQELLN